MKKIIIFYLVYLFSCIISYSASVSIYFDDGQFLIKGYPAEYIKIYYGSQIYTNNIVWPMRSITNSTPHTAFNAFSCNSEVAINRVVVSINGLVLNQTFYYGYSYINSKGVESRIISHSSCGFIVTNNVDVVLK